MEAKLEKITPETAAKYLAANTDNYRRLSPLTVSSYARDMANGLWQVNGEPIVFDKSGMLKDGQHRLKAIVQSGATVEIMVVRGVDEKVNVYDWGSGRTVQQWAGANKMVIPSCISGAVNVLANGWSRQQAKGTVTDYISRHYTDLRAALAVATSGKSDSFGNRAMAYLAAYVFMRLALADMATLINYYEVLNTSNIIPGQMRDPSPALTVSRQMFELKKRSNTPALLQEQFSITVQGLNDFKKNQSRSRGYPMRPETLRLLDQLRKADGLPERGEGK